MSNRLEGKVAIITGAGTGLGEAIAHKFAHEGARVVVNGLPDDPLEDVAQAIRSRGGEAAVYVGDISEDEHARACVQTAINQFGKLDVLVNNASLFVTVAETHEYPLEAFDHIIRNNLRATFLMTKYALPHLHKSRGNVISTGSEAGFNGSPKHTPYGGTKAWMHTFMKGVAVEQAKYGIRANCVCPGSIDTAWSHGDTGGIEADGAAYLDAVPLARRGTPEEMANVFAFLASDEASYVTGALWLVDGGVTLAKGLVGAEVPQELRQQPKGELDLQHSLDGLKGETSKKKMG